MTKIIVITLGAILINNFVLSRFLGICPFLGVSKKIETALGMGMAVIFVMWLASSIAYGVQILLDFFKVGYLQTVAFILVIATLVQLVEMFLKKMVPSLYAALGIYLPLITTNCAVLGVTFVNFNEHYNFIQSMTNGIMGAVGFTLAIVIFAGMRERLDDAPIPKAMEGFPLALILAGLLSLTFFAFMGFKIEGPGSIIQAIGMGGGG
ncbi:MAG: electron transport complex protein RnfA [Bacillota bacterium]